MIEAFASELMSAEADAVCGERSPDRVNSRNGHRSRTFDTRGGRDRAQDPQAAQWQRLPRLAARAPPAGRAVPDRGGGPVLPGGGLPTRRIDDIVKALGIEGISKSQGSAMAASLDSMVESLRTRPLDAGPYSYVWVDALVQREC